MVQPLTPEDFTGISQILQQILSNDNVLRKGAEDQLNAAKNTPASTGALLGNFVAIRDVITAAVEDILVNDADVTTRMASAQEEGQQLLDEYNELYSD